MNYILIEGDLLEADTKYIAHQCNCITNKGANLSKAMFDAFPYANIYSHRANKTDLPLRGEEPGNIIIKGDGINNRYVINMIAQYYPGKSRYPDGVRDGEHVRERFFKDCLLKITAIPNLESIAFPYNIGCGLAGGDWDVYEKLIDVFAKKMNEKNVKTYVYKLPAKEEKTNE